MEYLIKNFKEMICRYDDKPAIVSAANIHMYYDNSRRLLEAIDHGCVDELDAFIALELSPDTQPLMTYEHITNVYRAREFAREISP